MNNDYPRMLYRFPAQGLEAVVLQEGTFDTLIVADTAEHDAANADGWHDTSPDAKAAHAAALEAATVAVEKTAKPTRAELEAKATELGIAFTARTSDKKLGDQIAAALEE